MLKCDSFRPIIKYEITPETPNILLLLLLKITYSFLSIRMSEKSMNFGDKNIKKSNIYKNKKQFKIDDIDDIAN